MEDKIANAVVNAISENNSLLMLLVGAFGMFWLVDKVFFYVTKFGKDNGGNGSDPAHVVREVAQRRFEYANLVFQTRARDRHLARLVHHPVEDVGAHAHQRRAGWLGRRGRGGIH